MRVVNTIFVTVLLLLLSPACSGEFEPYRVEGLRIFKFDTYTLQSIGYYGVFDGVVVFIVDSGSVGPVYVICGPWHGLFHATGGHPPYSFAGSSLPAGMQVSTSGGVTWDAPCSAAGRTFNSTFTVSDSRGAQSARVNATFVVQTNGTWIEDDADQLLPVLLGKGFVSEQGTGRTFAKTLNMMLRLRGPASWKGQRWRFEIPSRGWQT